MHAISPTFITFMFVITRHAQLNTSSDCDIIQSPLIGLVRSLMVEYERHRLKLIDLQASSTMINESALVHALAQYMKLNLDLNNFLISNHSDPDEFNQQISFKFSPSILLNPSTSFNNIN
ncbi:unnamed protein product, partial [Adineta steineri]